MKTKLNQLWQVALPPSLVRQAGFADGETLECRAFRGTVCLSPEGAAFSFPVEEKKIHCGKRGAPALLLRGLPITVWGQAAGTEAEKGARASGPACL